MRKNVIRQSKRKKLSSEVGIGLLNCERYRTLWRETKLYADLPNVRTKIEVGWQAFERALDAKDFRITFLLNALSEAEAQSRRKDVAGTTAFDRSIRYHETRLRLAKVNFRCFLEKSLAQRDVQYEEIGDFRRDVDEHIRKIYLYLEHRREDISTNVRSNALSKIDAFVEDVQNERREQVACFEERLIHFCHELQRVLMEYRKGAEKRRSIYDALDDKDKKQRRIIARQYVEISSLRGQVENMRWKLTFLERGATNQLCHIAEESLFFRDIYREKLSYYVRCKDRDKNRARLVSRKYDTIWRYFKKLLTKAQHILALASLCRKYETQGDKILLPGSTIIDGASIMTMQRLFKNIQILYDIHGIPTLWHRVAAARATTWELCNRKRDLASRVSSLRQIITHQWAGQSKEKAN